MTPSSSPTALIADDEPLLREALARQLAVLWPELRIVAQARNGREAVALFEAKRPDICFLDVHMPGLSGVEAARQIGRRAHLVFVTAYDRTRCRPSPPACSTIWSNRWRPSVWPTASNVCANACARRSRPRTPTPC